MHHISIHIFCIYSYIHTCTPACIHTCVPYLILSYLTLHNITSHRITLRKQQSSAEPSEWGSLLPSGTFNDLPRIEAIEAEQIR